jgi:hypothetical protein
MALNRQSDLGYELAEIDSKLDVDLPITPDKLEQWLSQLPLLNIQELLRQIPSYIQNINHLAISDKHRFKMLELLRPIVAHIYREIIKRFRSEKGLNLSVEFQEMEWFIHVLLREMARGYQRLLVNIAHKEPGLFSRSHYALICERIMFYLSDRMSFVFMLHSIIPRTVWHDLHSTYRYALKSKLKQTTIKDDYVSSQPIKETIDNLYKRVLLISTLSPYSLRSAEIEQIYYGLLPLLHKIKLTPVTSDFNEGFVVNWQQDNGANFVSSVDEHSESWSIDMSELIEELKMWLETGKGPHAAEDKGMSEKLLAEMIGKLEGVIQRKSERFPVDGQQVEVIIGLPSIEAFLGHVDALKNDDEEMPIQEIKNDEFTIDHYWGEKSKKGDWDSFSFNPLDGSKPELKKQTDKNSEPEIKEIRRYFFEIENESEAGVCLSCELEQAKDLFIGELIFILGQDLITWTLGIVRWMKVENNKINLGVYFLGEKVDFITVHSSGVREKNKATHALLLHEGYAKETVLVPSAQFKSGDEIIVKHRDLELTIQLSDVIWKNEVFSQFLFELIRFDGGDTPSSEHDYLIP